MPDQTSSEKKSRPELSAPPADKRPLIATIVIFVVLLILFIAAGVYLFMNPAITSVLRDMFIILLALETIVIALISMVLVVTLVYLVLKINDLVQLVSRETEPLLQKVNDTALIAKDTAKTVQSRVTVVSDEAVKPVVNALSAFSAAKAMIKTLFGR